MSDLRIGHYDCHGEPYKDGVFGTLPSNKPDVVMVNRKKFDAFLRLLEAAKNTPCPTEDSDIPDWFKLQKAIDELEAIE